MAPQTLLDLLSQHTLIDLDQNDARIAELYPGLLNDMTSNQAIVYGELATEAHVPIILEAVLEAQKLVAAGVEGAKGREVAAVAVDLMGIKLALTVFPYLALSGFVHSQTNPSAARSVEKTVPATVAGLRACAILEKEGITTLGTVICCEGQALMAGEVPTTYISPYINELAKHFGKAHEDNGPHGLEGYQVAASAQATFRARGIKTKVMAASLITAEESLCLAGLQHATLGGKILGILAATPATAEHEALVAQSVAYYAAAVPSTAVYSIENVPDDQLLPTGCDAYAEELTRSALEIFGGFEAKLMELAVKTLADVQREHN
ncbi:hypothetical protein RQP46_005188 [Phenoliferia psychrophenolica]